MRFPADNGADRQDPLIAPIGTLVDQSEIVLGEGRPALVVDAQRPVHGRARAACRPGRREGRDRAEPRAHQSRLGAADGVQERRAVRAALLRHRPGDDQRRRAPRRRRALGERLHHDVLPQPRVRRGRHARLPGRHVQCRRDLAHHADWSVFASYSEGFTLPNIGIPLRNINRPGQSVEGILDLQAIIFDNKEVGFNWRGDSVSLSALRTTSRAPTSAPRSASIR